LVAVPGVLGLAGLVIGVLSPAVEKIFTPYTEVYESGYESHLALWSGFVPAFWVSVGVWIVGTLLFLGNARIAMLQRRLHFPFEASRTYQLVVRGVDRLALEVTGGFQRGSLPSLLAIILMVLVTLPAVQFLRGATWPDSLRWFDSPQQVGVGIVVIVAAIATTRARRRLRAVFLVSVTGYGTAMLFLFHGAPDLALTQVLVETVTLVVFVLVLRRLSGRFPDDPTVLTRRVRALLGISVGTVVGVLAALAAGSRVHEPAGVDLAERSVDYGGGSNIVNVILVDVRAWDTRGELSVVLATATGVASLIFLRDDNMQCATRGILRARSRWAGGRVEPDAEPVT